VNTDQEQELSRLFSISSIPVVLYIPKEGSPQMSVGALPEETFRKAINDVLKVNQLADPVLKK
jgi:thioredoxin-like negative regulator of GroEL